VRVTLASLAISAGALLALAYLIPLPARLSQPSSTVIDYRDGTPAHVFLSPDEKWRIHARLEEIDPKYLDALLEMEDKRFYRHPGVDGIALLRASLSNASAGRVVSGGSTITLQLVRVLEPRPRTIPSKIKETLRAFQLELRMSKREILEAYLQYVPYGKNVEGVEAASLAYFGHGASSLSESEIATLLAVPQRPTSRHPAPEHAARLAEARDRIAARLFGDEVARTVAAEPVPTAFKAFPRDAPHAAEYLKARYPKRERLVSTLDRNTQLLVQRLFDGARGELANKAIYNGAAVVVDQRHAEVRALVGNFDYWDARHGGAINGFATPRSTGSALKPFVYALALDGAEVLPDYLVPDVPRSFGGYVPHNYDDRYGGLVRLQDALSRSLNTVFVDLLNRLGVERFLAALESMGVDSIAGAVPGTYGLNAAVGGLELTPLEVASTYTTLANDGDYQPLHLLVGERRAKIGSTIFSPGAASLTRIALAEKDRPDFPARRRFTGAGASIYWKTGTSYGHRDAWAAGSSARYTAVVWLGNFDNSPSASLVGADAAGPILFDVLEGLKERGDRFTALEPTPDLAPVEVCAYSGRLPGPACDHKKTVLAPRDHLPTEHCPFHVTLDVDTTTGRALTPMCRAGHDFKPQNFLLWPDELRRYLHDAHLSAPAQPNWAEGCEPVTGRHAPSILSPRSDQTVLLIPGLEADKQQIPLEGASPTAGASLTWFVDGRFLGTVGSDERLWWAPAPGRHEIVVTDEVGLSTHRRLDVRGNL
jgi:penicillin-binding protein 1C